MSGPGSGQDSHYPLLCGAWQLVFTSPGVIHHITGVEITTHQDLSRNNYWNQLFLSRARVLTLCESVWVLTGCYGSSWGSAVYWWKRRWMCWMFSLCPSSHLHTLMTRSDTRWVSNMIPIILSLRKVNEYFLELFVWISCILISQKFIIKRSNQSNCFSLLSYVRCVHFHP